MSNRSIDAVVVRLRFGDSDGDDHDIAADYIDALRKAAEKVTCKYCGGLGWIVPLYEDDRTFEKAPCPDCAALRALLNPEIKS